LGNLAHQLLVFLNEIRSNGFSTRPNSSPPSSETAATFFHKPGHAAAVSLLFSPFVALRIAILKKLRQAFFFDGGQRRHGLDWTWILWQILKRRATRWEKAK
jgi:hypothetical protein